MRRRSGIHLPTGLGWCTVTATGDSIRVRVDGASSDSPVNVNATGAMPSVNDRLMWTGVGKQLVLIGDPRPVGEVMQSSVSFTPPNSSWLLADGSSVLRADYPSLDAVYSAVGYPWGTADSTHLYLPALHDGNGRMPRATTVGEVGGGDPTASHHHTQPAHQHSHSHAHGSSQMYAAISVNSVGQVTVRDPSDVPGDPSPSWTETRRLNLGSSTWGGNVSSGRTVGAEVRGVTDGPGAVNTDNAGGENTGDTAGQWPWFAGLAFFVKVK